MKRRNTAQLILLDRASRIFLIKIEDPGIAHEPDAPPHRRPFWITPGGRIEEGEALRATLVRELEEETGIPEDLVEIGDCMWTGEHDLMWNGELTHLHERYHLARVLESGIDLGGMTAEEKEVYRDHRWWTLEELQTSVEVFLPKDIRTLLAPIIRGELPERPIEIDLSAPPELFEDP